MRSLMLLIYTLLSITAFSQTHSRMSNTEKKVLILNSYHQDLVWTQDIMKGLNQVLDHPKNKFDVTFDKTFEYLDFKKHTDSIYENSLYDFFKIKYKASKFDLIICTDDNALDFLLKHKKELYGDSIPVIFSGINCPRAYSQEYTGVYENFEINSLIEIIDKLHPKHETIYIINDKSETGKQNEKKILMDLSRKFYNKKYEFLTDYSFDELLDKVSNLKKQDIIILMSFTTDKNGRYIDYIKGLEQIRNATKNPIYSVWDFYLGHGIIGGAITTGLEQGRLAGEVAKRVANGESPIDIKAIKAGYSYLFDYEELKAHNIKASLPDGSIMVNDPLSYLNEHLEIIISISVVFFVMIFIVILLSMRIRLKKREIEREQDQVRLIQQNEEKLRREKIRAEEANRIKSTFMANMSHEIRTPLNAIMGFSDLLAKDNVSPSKRQTYIDVISSNGNAVLKLIDDIIDIAKIETGLFSVSKSDYNINEMLKELKYFYNGQKLKKHKGDVEIRTSPENLDKKFVISTDGNRLRQVVMNLMNYALKYTDKGYIELGYKLDYSARPMVRFFVKDSGQGIPDNLVNKMLEGIWSTDHLADQKDQSAGMALSISRKIIELLGGSIWIEASSGVGTTYFFTLPFNPSEFVPDPESLLNKETPRTLYYWNDKRILVAEDEDNNFFLLREILAPTRVEITRALDGIEAVNYCQNDDGFDLVLMDIKMPRMNGLEATQRIKQFRADLPIIAQTAFAMAEDSERSAQAGCDAYIVKPIKKEDLLSLISNYFDL